MAAQKQPGVLLSWVCVCLCLPDFSSTRSYWGGEVRLGGGIGKLQGGREREESGVREGAWELRNDNNKVFIWQPDSEDFMRARCPRRGWRLITFPSAVALSGGRLFDPCLENKPNEQRKGHEKQALCSSSESSG